MGFIHSQLLPSPKSVGGWGSAPEPPPPNSEEERLCACQSDTPKGGAPIPIFAPGARNPRYTTDDGSKLEVNVVLNWQPVKFFQHRGDVVVLPSFGDDSGQGVLDSLEFVDIRR